MRDALTKGELLDVTGTPQVERQRSVLRGWGIDAKPKADGSLMVTWAVINAVQQLDEEANLSEDGVNPDNPLVRMVVSNDATTP